MTEKTLALDRLLALATRNEGKISEYRSLLSNFNIEIKGLDDFGTVPQVEEDGKTFEDNAIKKARVTAGILGLPTLADDSGLMVKALDGMPGVLSARYAGEHATDSANNLKLIQAMKGVEDRAATFVCVIAIAAPGGGDALIYKGRCDGLITQEPAGDQGFGYDPVFYYSPMHKTFAQMSAQEKNSVSHRGRAMSEVRNEFDKVLTWLRQNPGFCDF